MIKRREFITLLGGVAATWPVAARAQQAAKTHRIGYLSPITSSADATRSEAFLHGLSELGYVEGRSIIIERRFAEGQLDQLSPLATELVGVNVDLVVAAGGDLVARAVSRVNGTIPIVITNGEDPVRSGLVASLARPGGNVTGLTSIASDFSAHTSIGMPGSSCIAT